LLNRPVEYNGRYVECTYTTAGLEIKLGNTYRWVFCLSVRLSVCPSNA